ncbi:MAG: B12-binding domain-containing radical SAM protein [Saprospiraceae bacterium]|nr:B12-binding domain-containing radical SAM protein [Saprospiraceae bacterium]
MKALIINSPLFREENHLYDEDSLPPIGLGYIGTQLRQHGIEVKLIDAVAHRISLDAIINLITEYTPDFVGINIFTTNYELVKDLIESLHFPTHIVVGGLSTKQLYNQILTWRTPNPIDVVTGDGELIMLDIVNKTVRDKPFHQEGNRRVFQINEASNYLVKDISDIPLDRSFFTNEPTNHPLGFTEANIVASRGCIYNCTFCAAARSLNKDYPVRERSDASIMAELQEIQQGFPKVNSIRVLDDLFLKSEKSIQKAINVFSPFPFQWRSMAHVQTFRNVDDGLMKKLKASGCYELFIGIESGSPKILTDINKTKNVRTIVDNLTKVFRAGINIKGYFIFGFPGETEEDMEMTYQLAMELKQLSLDNGVNFRTSVFQYRPYHATQIYHHLEAQGKNLWVTNMAPNAELTSLVGRYQFNFHSGNFSAVEYQVVESYICRTINLNGSNIFSNLESSTQALQEKL